MGKPALIFALVVLLAAVGRADWTVTTTEKERTDSGRMERRHLVLDDTGAGEHATLEIAIFSSKTATLRVVDNPAGEDDLAAAMVRERCLAGVNGGYFDPADKPVGLLMSDGKLIAPLRKAKLLSGLVLVADSRVQLLRTAEYSSKRKAREALQAGPFLVDRGIPVPGLEATRTARRTFIATSNGDRALIGFCSYVTLAQMGEILAQPDLLSDFKVQRALNFDGGSSSAFWFARDRGAFSISEQKTVRDFVGVVAK